MEKQIDEKKKKKKGDRCVRIAKRKYDVWPSAYASGAVVKCRKGKIWKGLSEEELNEMIDEEVEQALDENFLKNLALAGTMAAGAFSPSTAQAEKPAVVQQDKQEANVVSKNGVSYIGAKGYSNRIYIVSEKHIKQNEQLSQSEYVKQQLQILNKKNSKKLFSAKDKSNGPYRMVELVVREIKPGEKIIDIDINDNTRDQWQQVENALGKDWEKRFSGEFWGAQGKNNPTHFIYKEANLEEKKKPDFKKEKESGLHGWFSRQGGKGKSKGWVDCNTCRKDEKTGKKTCKTCGRKEGEKRSKYPSCRPKPSDCSSSGKGKDWGKKSAKKESLHLDEELIQEIAKLVLEELK